MATKRPDSFEEFQRKQKAKSPPPSHNAPESGSLSQDELASVEAGRTAMQSLRKTFDLWVTVGRAIQTLRARADRAGGRKTFQRLLDQQGFHDLDKATVTRLLHIMENLAAVVSWHETLTDKQKREWASPSAIYKHCPVFKKDKPRESKKQPSPSPAARDQEIAALKAHVQELEAARPESGPESRTLLGLLTDLVAVAKDPANWPASFPPKQAANLVKALGKVRDAVAAGAPPQKKPKKRGGVSVEYDEQGKITSTSFELPIRLR